MNATHHMMTESHRPETLDEVVGHDVAVARFRRFLDPQTTGGMPHSLLHGPPGVGKTALADSYAQELFGEDYSANFREFNASDERGIDVVRDRIKGWCRTAPSGGHPYKIIFLDEADALTNDAQSALRRTMEQYSDQTRFILSCNYVSEIIDPLQSRCADFHFGLLSDDEIETVVDRVLEAEDIEAEGSAKGKLVRSANGKARDAIMTIQNSVVDGEITEDWVESVTGVVDPALVEEIFEIALKGDHDTAMRRFDVELLKEGASPNRLVATSFEVIRDMEMPEDWRVKCFELLSKIDERLRMGMNPHIQFHALLGHIYMAQSGSVYRQQRGGSDE